MVTNAGKYCHVAWWVPCCLLTVCTQSLPDQRDAEAMAGLVMGQVVLQPQLCPSTEIMLSISPDWKYKKPCLADAVIAVDFDIINPKFFWFFFFVETNKFGCAFVPSYTACSEDTGWDGLILPIPECSFERLFRTASCHLQTQCLSSGDVPEKLRRVLHHRDV